MVGALKELLKRQRNMIDYARKHSINVKPGSRKLSICTAFRYKSEKQTLY